jgi:hypothetical protein
MASKNLIQYQSINSYQIHLNSASATYNNGTYKSDCTFILPDMIDNTKKTIELRISLVNAQIPVSFYQINQTNNKLNITISGTKTSYYFPYGNYNINTFITQWASTVGAGWILTLNSSTNTLNIANTTTDFSLTDDTNSIFGIIGLVKGTTCNSSNKIIVSPYPVNFSGLQRLLITSPTFNLFSKTSYDSGETNILSSIPNNSVQNGYIYYNNLTNFKSIFSNTQLSNIQIQFVDDFSNFINFNNIDWTLTLQIDNVHEIIQDLSTLKEVYDYEINNLQNNL